MIDMSRYVRFIDIGPISCLRLFIIHGTHLYVFLLFILFRIKHRGEPGVKNGRPSQRDTDLDGVDTFES